MESFNRYPLIRAARTAMLAALALALTLVPALPVARAENARTGDEPWYRQAPSEARQQAQALFVQAIDKHLQLLRGDALALYEQALALWDNPDIQWNLALVLEDLGQYLRAYEQLERALRWEEALGPERLRQVRERMAALETQRLARIETDREEPAAVITLDGKPWHPRAGRRSAVVLPGEHYLASHKAGHFPVTRNVYVKAGELARVPLSMDEDRRLENRRWTAWKPWAVVAAGALVAAVGAGLEWRALAHGDEAPGELAAACNGDTCDTVHAGLYERAVLENRLAIGAFAAGGAAIGVGLALVWINRPRAYRTEARDASPIQLTPILSPDQAGVSALIRF